MQCMHTNS